jgi:hypothetical protein
MKRKQSEYFSEAIILLNLIFFSKYFCWFMNPGNNAFSAIAGNMKITPWNNDASG